MSKHDHFMLEAIRLSSCGFPAPNPRVGCVIVKDDAIVGRGYCNHDGGSHAEVIALRESGPKAHEATAYVTLEPCNHVGRTPPCSLALVEAGIKNVFIGTTDQNPIAEGGAAFLQQRGIEVSTSVCSLQAAEVNHQFLFAIAHQRPLVTVKAGMTLDGKIALPNGKSKWITCEESRLDAMKLRAEMGCVLVGRVTAEVDQARLNVRGIDVINQPLRVVLDPKGCLDSNLPVFDESAPTLHLTNQSGIGSPAEVLQRLWERGRTGVLIEGGPTTTAHFFNADLVDQVVLYIAPKVFGEGKSWAGPFGLSDLTNSPSFELIEMKKIENDLKLVYQSRNLRQYLESYLT